MTWAVVLLALVWLGIAAGVTTWALRARREQQVVDLRTRPEGLLLVDRIGAADVGASDDHGRPTGA